MVRTTIMSTRVPAQLERLDAIPMKRRASLLRQQPPRPSLAAHKGYVRGGPAGELLLDLWPAVDGHGAEHVGAGVHRLLRARGEVLVGAAEHVERPLLQQQGQVEPVLPPHRQTDSTRPSILLPASP